MRRRSATSLGSLLESFFLERLLSQRRASPATIESYRDAWKLFLLYVSERCERSPSKLKLDDLDRPTVLAFLDYLEKKRGCSARTRNARLTAIRSFFSYVAYREPSALGLVQRVQSIQSKRTVQPLVNHLNPLELDALLAAPDQRSLLGLRDFVLLSFLARTGARVSEAIRVNRNELLLDRAPQVLLHGKGSKQRAVPLDRDTARSLRELCRALALHPADATPVFVNTRGQRLTRFGVTHLVRRAVALAAKSEPSLARRAVSPHTLRHTAAMRLLQAGVDLTVIRSWLGHVSLDTTHHYIEADVEMKRRALEKCPGTLTKPSRYRPSDRVLAMLEQLSPNM